MDFPIEILSIIFAFSDPPSLALLIRTSRLFKTLAEPLLYRNIVFIDHDEFRHKSRQAFIQQIARIKQQVELFKQRIDEAPYLATLVVSYTTQHVDELSAVLPKLTNLRRLKIGSASFLGLPLLERCFSPAMRLTHLVCHETMEDILAWTQFLETQPGLEFLDFCCDDWMAMDSLSPDALPRLRTLGARLEVVRSILPGRDIRHLELSDPEPLLDMNPLSFFPTVRTLFFHILDGELTEVTPAIARIFPNLKYLCIGALRSDQSRLDEDIDCLLPLAATKIEYICFRFQKNFLASYRNTISDLAACFKELPSLRTLDIGFSIPFQSITLVFRHHLGCSAPVEITLPADDWASWELWWEHTGIEYSLESSGADVTFIESAEACI